jgi:hypothetical protein
VFQSALGIDQSKSPDLQQILLQIAANGEAIAAEKDAFGQRYTIDFQRAGKLQMVTIRSAWIIRNDEDFPRLVTCYVMD